MIIKKRKGQMEIIGLVFIVILLTIGMLFVAKFGLNEDTSKKIFTRKGLAYSAMSAVMKTNVKDACLISDFTGEVVLNNLKISDDLLEDCAKNQGSKNQIYCNGLDSCQYLNNTISELLNLTLGTWNKNYRFESRLIKYGDTTGAGDLVVGPIGTRVGCPKTVDRDTSGNFPINIEGVGFVESILYLCD